MHRLPAKTGGLILPSTLSASTTMNPTTQPADVHSTIYCRANHPGSWFIRAMDDFGPYSHCAGILADGKNVIEATALKGVVVTPLSEVIARSSDYIIVERQVSWKWRGDSMAFGTVGAGYDWLGALSIKFGRDWEDPRRWFCSEHNEWWQQQAGLVRFVRETQHGVSPLDSVRVR